eukprot:GHUV01051901.1.p1 GENE.GHUV01051901.1~~GHUV01051901.1.p1  ORF type:complete len:165 (+),score=13.72 GHUV01051901.1:720-1214(+)
MGLDRNTKTPCGFCFVMYHRRRDAVAAVRYLNGTKLDNRQLRADIDYGFEEGRQFGRGRSGGQVGVAGCRPAGILPGVHRRLCRFRHHTATGRQCPNGTLSGAMGQSRWPRQQCADIPFAYLVCCKGMRQARCDGCMYAEAGHSTVLWKQCGCYARLIEDLALP